MAGQDKGSIGVGVIGCGSVADLAHFPSLKEIPQCRLEAACDPVAEYRERSKARFSIPCVFADYQEMLKLPSVQLVIVASPNVFHRDHAVDALQAGKDVIIEKPFACTNREAWDIVEAAKKNKRRVMVGCNYRFWDQHLIAKDLLSRGVIGELKMGTSKSHESWSLYHEMISYTRFRADPASCRRRGVVRSRLAHGRSADLAHGQKAEACVRHRQEPHAALLLYDAG